MSIELNVLYGSGMNDQYGQIGFKNAIVVGPADDLAAKYAWLKSSDRDGDMGALTALNRRVMILAPGVYTLTTKLTLDTDYVDIAALVPMPGGQRLTAHHEWDGEVNAATVNVSGFLPPPTLITGSLAVTSLADTGVVVQSANDVRMHGFGIANTHDPGEIDIDTYGATDIYASAFTITASDNTPSRYSMMYFWQTGAGVWCSDPSGFMRMACYSTGHFKGRWDQCTANGFAYRAAANKNFSPVMCDCIGGAFSFAGDATNLSMENCALHRCEGIGYFNEAYQSNTSSGYACFGGCRSYGCAIANTAYLYDCIAGDQSYGLGLVCAGNFYGCIGGDNCFGGYRGVGAAYGTFSGVAEDCRATSQSFGSGHASCVNSGRMTRCRLTAMPEAMFCTGAKIEDSYLQVTGTNKSTLDLNDGNTVIYNSTLIANGNGECITAGEAQNVVAGHCRSNKGVNANVTNLLNAANSLTGAAMGIEDSDIA